MALLFSLGILAMMLVLALVFATNAMIERKVAASYGDKAKAELLAKTAVQRILMMNQYKYDRMKVGDPTFGGITNVEPEEEWFYIYDNDQGIDSLDNRGRIIGRYRYAQRVAGPSLNPRAIAMTGIDEGADNEFRFGVSPYEINIGNLTNPRESGYLVGKVSGFNYVGFGGVQPIAGWPSFDDLCNDLVISLDEQDDENKQFRKWFIIGATNDAESFWVDAGASLRRDETYHRFNLSRMDWNTLTVDSILLGVDTVWADSGSFDGNTIRWLKEYTNLDPGSFPSAEVRAKQIIANLIDYCDFALPEAITTDSATDPTYTGNEKTPYLNEIGLNIECTALVHREVDGGTGDERFKLEYIFTTEIRGERIDMYSGLLAGCTLEILDGNITYRYAMDYDGTLAEQMMPLAGVNIAIAGSTADYQITGAAGPLWQFDTGWLHWRAPNSTQPTAQIVDLKVQIKRAKLSYDGIYCDFAKPNYDDSWSETIPTLVKQDGTGGNTDEAWFSWQADDPRQNLNPGDWEQAKAAITDNYDTLGTPGAVNENVTCATAGDAEHGSTPTTISTAFVRNGMIMSPWELGCIHRGAKWETINLKKYNTNAKNVTGIGAYEDGDANILDQVKMTSATSVLGKININVNDPDYEQSSLDTLGALFTKIYAHDNYMDPAANEGLEVTLAIARDLAKKIVDRSVNTPIRYYRASLVNLVDEICTDQSQGGILPTNNCSDAVREAIIGKVANLLKTAPLGVDGVTVLIQAIKDIGDNVTIVKEIYDPEQEKMVEVTFSNCRYGQMDQTDIHYADEIMAEVKVEAVIEIDENEQYKIVSFEYIWQ